MNPPITTVERIADALRVIAMRLDAGDLLETLLAVADELDPTRPATNPAVG